MKFRLKISRTLISKYKNMTLCSGQSYCNDHTRHIHDSRCAPLYERGYKWRKDGWTESCQVTAVTLCLSELCSKSYKYANEDNAKWFLIPTQV